MNEEQVRIGYINILDGLYGRDVWRTEPHLADTPGRAARALCRELCAGLHTESPEVTTFESDADEMVLLRHIPIRSLCAHHLLPFVGEAAVAYIPGSGALLGLSKLSRIVDYWARRPQVQENLTVQIADALAELVMLGKPPEMLGGGGVGVVIQARHMCMELRGVTHAGEMVTSALRGVFLHGDAKHEFLRLVGGNNT